MGFIFIPIIIVGLLFSFGLYLSALYTRSVNSKSQKGLWRGAILSTSMTLILMLIYAAVRSSVTLSDIFIVVFLLSTAGLLLSLLFNKKYKNKYNERGKFNLTTGITIGMLVLSLVFIGTSADTEKVEDNTGAALVEASIDEVTEEDESAEEAKAEKKAEEEKAAEEAEVEKKAAEEKAAEEAEEADEKVPVKDGLIPVQLYRVVDGDTVHVIDEHGNNLNLRLLLIDTPETVHPTEPVQPYGQEASARLTELLNNANQLYIEYDDGEKQDHYMRELVYLYADDVSVHEVLLEEGLARVGYIYEQQRYLEEFRAAEQYAKDNQLGVWSIPGYVNEDGEGFNYEEEADAISEPASDSPSNNASTGSDAGANASYNFQNCTDLKEVFPDGVSSDHPAYQPKMDRDKDNHACE